MADVFISYARADQAQVAPIAAALEQAGYTVWWDRHIKGGHDFSEDIEQELEAARAVVVLWSEASVKSHWVRDEAATARDAGKLIPVSIDDAPSPMGFRQLHTIDLTKADGNDDLNGALAELLGGNGKAKVAVPKIKPKRKHSPWVIAAIALIAIAGATGVLRPDFWDRMFGSGSSTTEASERVENARSVVVLPFVANSSGDDDQYFADGVTEEILNRLDALPELRVVPRTTAFTYKGKDVALEQAAKELNVEHVVEGSMHRSGDAVKVTARLVRAAGSKTLWSNSYDVTLDDVFEVQADIAENVAAALNILLDDQKRAAMDEVGIDNPEAYTLYAKGYDMFAEAHGMLTDMRPFAEAVKVLDQAFAMEPKLARAQIMAADFEMHIILDEAGGRSHTELPAELRNNARANLDRRLELAYDSTTGEPERLAIRLLQAGFSDDWSRVPSLSRSFYSYRDTCANAGWPGFGYAPYGNAGSVFDFYSRQLSCDFDHQNYWSYLTMMGIMAGRLDDLEKMLARGDETLSERSFLNRPKFELALTRGDFETASKLVADLSERSGYMLAAAAGRKDKIPSVDWIREDPPYKQLQWFAQSGRKKEVNELAALIDGATAGPTVLQIAVDECLCGAPFDISRTPNFAKRVDELGAKWPPKTPTKWPLKDW